MCTSIAVFNLIYTKNLRQIPEVKYDVNVLIPSHRGGVLLSR